MFNDMHAKVELTGSGSILAQIEAVVSFFVGYAPCAVSATGLRNIYNLYHEVNLFPWLLPPRTDRTDRWLVVSILLPDDPDNPFGVQ